MSKGEKQKHQIESIARSMEAEGFDFETVKKILEKQVIKTRN